MTERLKNRVVVVTAGAAGIGRATAQRMAAEGARVIAADVDRGGLDELAAGSAIEMSQLDVTDAEAVAALAARLRRVDVLVNCVGIVPVGTVLECSEDSWTQAMNINVTSCFRMIKAFLPGMLEAGGGSIINISSVVSSLKGAPSRFCYATTKAALIGLTKSVAVDFVQRGIRCNAVCPGTVDTPSLQQRLTATGDYARARREFEARQPMGRLAQPEEIASLVAYLASDEARFVTGQAYAIDGGWSI